MTQHLGLPIPSPALFDKTGQKFRRAVASFADANHIPWVRRGRSQGRCDGPYLNKAAATGRAQVVAIGVAQEFQRVWTAPHGTPTRQAPQFTFAKKLTGGSPCSTSTCGCDMRSHRVSEPAGMEGRMIDSRVPG